jgi:hypothetical protein
MKSWNDPFSPFGKQLRFDDHEFEAMMEEVRSRTGDRQSFTPGKGVDIDLVLRRSERIEADYVDLPAGIMGRTIFSENGSVYVEISRALSDAAEHDRVARRRLRTTLAHEVGHIACHRGLFIRDTETFSLFADRGVDQQPMNRQPIMCREHTVGRVNQAGPWWEIQANACMAALLLPRALISASTRKRLADGGFKTGDECFRRGHGRTLIREIADEFDVSHIATLYRLQKLGFVSREHQREMTLTD